MVEADLLRFYGLDLAEEFDELGCRRLWVLLNGLPSDAATWRVEGRQWTVQEELLALIAERVDAWGLLNARLSVDKKSQKHLPNEPLLITRPGQEKEPDRRDRVITDAAEIAAFFGT